MIDIDGQPYYPDIGGTTPVVSEVTSSSTTLELDTTSTDIFKVLLDASVTLDISGDVDGKSVIIFLKQGSGGSKTITLGSSLSLPSSATTPLAFSTTAGKTDILAAKYESVSGKWLVVSMVPGY